MRSLGVDDMAWCCVSDGVVVDAPCGDRVTEILDVLTRSKGWQPDVRMSLSR